MENRFSLNSAELDAIRELQAGMPQLDSADPIWEVLADVGLVDMADPRVPQLTLMGRGYLTDNGSA